MSALRGKEDIAARQNPPHVFLIGCKHTTNPSASCSLCSPDAWMQAYGSSVKYLSIISQICLYNIFCIFRPEALWLQHCEQQRKKMTSQYFACSPFSTMNLVLENANLELKETKTTLMYG